MSEGIPQGQRENPELSRLIEELELQIESVNAGLSKIRGTVARISYAAFGSATPASSSSWGESLVAPANRNEWHAAVTTEPPPAPPDAPAPMAVTDHTPPLAIPHSDVVPDIEAATGLWNSIAEGASWPRLHETGLAEGHHEPSSVNGFGLADEVKADEPVAQQSAWPDMASAEPEAAPTEEPVEEVPSAVEASWGADESGGEAVPGAVQGVESVWGTEAAAENVEPPPATTSRFGEMPKTLSSGWPDEGAWSQGFEWPSMKKNGADEAAAEQPKGTSNEEHVDVSDIVAQVKAELEAARRGDAPMPSDTPVPFGDLDFGNDSEAATPEVPEEASEPDLDDEARREEVSRAVAEMRQQLEAGNFEDVMRGHPASGQSVDPKREDFSAWGRIQAEPEPEPEGDSREEVRKTVEAARQELSAGDEKPVFRLAAPGSIPDWSHMQMEPSGPPVVVMKDAEGRVELASVYETLNELGCGDGAALLNYTPHSVTVGLPATASFPSKEKVAAAVEKVFGLSSRVESDGVRLTVSIGAEPKRKSEDAA